MTIPVAPAAKRVPNATTTASNTSASTATTVAAVVGETTHPEWYVQASASLEGMGTAGLRNTSKLLKELHSQ
ncbi:hypothetical protein KIPB_013929, partial [Kipferlia bialata]|eukprot:g13929.t1